MSGEGFYPGIGIGMIAGFALLFIVVAICIAGSSADRIADEERLKAMRKEGW